MKIKKTLTDKVIAANRRNAQQSTGANNIAAVKYNAVKHGILAKGLLFRSDEEASEFAQLQAQLEKDLRPADTLERILVEEIAVCYWKLRIVVGLEVEDIKTRQVAAGELLRKLISDCDDRLTVASDKGPGSPSRDCVQKVGWDCKEVVLSSGNHTDDVLGNELSDMTGSPRMEMRLGSSLETIMRYEGSVKRDLYKAIEMFQRLQKRQGASSAAESEGTGPKPGASSGQFTKRSH